MKLNNVTSSVLLTFLVIFALIYAKPILVPFVIALLIWFVVKKIRNLIDKIGFVHRYIPKWIKTVLASFLIFNLIVFISTVLTNSIESLGYSYQKYISNIEVIALRIKDVSGIDLSKEVTHFAENFELTSYLESLINSLSEILGSMVMIVFYTIFLFIEETLFKNKIKLMFSDNEQHNNVQSTLLKIDKTLARYISLKSMIAFMTSTLGFIIFYSVGLDSPMFWAFLLFMLNFIPSVGPIIATLLPALFSLIQFGEFTPFFIILGALGAASVLIGNFVEPKLMGNTLNISPLVAVLSLAVWGSIWGITGMLLSVPITVAMIIVFSQFKSTRNIAILLSERGRV